MQVSEENVLIRQKGYTEKHSSEGGTGEIIYGGKDNIRSLSIKKKKKSTEQQHIENEGGYKDEG